MCCRYEKLACQSCSKLTIKANFLCFFFFFLKNSKYCTVYKRTEFILKFFPEIRGHVNHTCTIYIAVTFPSCLTNISFYCCLQVYKSDWKVHRLTKIFSWIWPNEVYFQHSVPCGLHTSFISVAMCWSHQSKKSSTTNMMSAYEIFCPAYNI